MPAAPDRPQKAFGPYANIMYVIASIGMRVSKLPIIGAIIDHFFARGHFNVITVPVDIKINGESAILPYDATRRLIEESSYIVAATTCVCREGNGCKDYPKGLGCMFLGEGARSITLKGRAFEISKEEALQRLERSRSLGLVSNLIWSDLELMMLGAEAGRTIELCSCCPCCCLAFKTRNASKAFLDNITGFGVAKVILPGKCSACSKCVQSCPFGAISISTYREPLIDSGRCKGCGRCEAVCKYGVLKVFPILPEGGFSSVCMDAKAIESGRELFEKFLAMVR
jgi:NAD-dependent dihydropyrimidine dehydrogenase PreA subunit